MNIALIMFYYVLLSHAYLFIPELTVFIYICI